MIAEASVATPRARPRMGGRRLEHAILLRCARAHMDGAGRQHLSDLVGDGSQVDWTYLVAKAASHDISALLCQNLILAEVPVPQDILTRLQESFRANAMHSMFLTQELLKLISALETQEIPVVTFKGPSLAILGYRDLALRQFGDLDVLVRKRDVLRARDVLVSQGYRSKYHWNQQLTAAQEALLLRSNYQYTFERADGRVEVELHWLFTPRSVPFPFRLENVWECLERVPLAGQTVLSLRREELLLVLCAHGARHCWESLKMVCDVSALVDAHPGMNWDRVLDGATRLGARRMLFVGLLLSSDVLQSGVSAEVLGTARADPTARSLAGEIKERLFSRTDDPIAGLAKELFFLRIRERWRDRASQLRRLGPTERDLEFLPLPGFLFFLYYLYRPIRLLIEFFRPPQRRFPGTL